MPVCRLILARVVVPMRMPLGKTPPRPERNHAFARGDFRIAVHIGHGQVRRKVEGCIDPGHDPRLARVLQERCRFAIRVDEQQDPRLAAGDRDGFADKAVGVEHGHVVGETVIAPAINLEALPPVGRVAADHARGDGAEGGMLLQIQKLAQAEVFAARFAKGADLLAQKIVVVAQLLVLPGQEPARLDERQIVAQFHKRRAKLYENHTQLGRKTGRLAEEYNPAHHQQPDNDPISTVQTKLPCCRSDPSTVVNE